MVRRGWMNSLRRQSRHARNEFILDLIAGVVCFVIAVLFILKGPPGFGEAVWAAVAIMAGLVLWFVYGRKDFRRWRFLKYAIESNRREMEER